MNLKGHRKITERAIEKLEAMLGQNRTQHVRPQLYGPRPGSNTGPRRQHHRPNDEVGPAYYAVQRDLIDVVTFNHWRDSGQRHHFMRPERQSSRQAYQASIQWIETNLQAYAAAVAREQGKRKLQSLGNALHAIEDSFSRSHVTRSPFAAGNPGAIEELHVYSGQDHDEHSRHDEEWGRETWILELAADACAEAVRMVLDETTRAGTRFAGLRGFVTYRERWLKASPRLSRMA